MSTPILGIKMTHDAAVAVIDNGRLLFSIEREKIDNNPRHAIFPDLMSIRETLAREGMRDEDCSIVFDGWNGGTSRKHPWAEVAPYHEGDHVIGDAEPWGDVLRPRISRVVSFPHLAGHIVGAYAMSPWAATRAPAYVIIWDGGTGPRLYLVDPDNSAQPVSFICHLGFLYGTIYGIMGYYAGPYMGTATVAADDFLGRRDWPGKLMSWMGKGVPCVPLLRAARRINAKIEAEMRARPSVFINGYQQDGTNEHRFMREMIEAAATGTYSDADLLASVHAFLEELLVERAMEWIPRGSFLAFAGGSALNIKWNSALRASGHFADVFVPPTANDSGSAIGAACALRACRDDAWSLQWDVYAGPTLDPVRTIPAGWDASSCDLARLALLIESGPVVILHGRAEIGPRALGHRSILADPRTPMMQDRLNAMKGRESWRPVAPIVLEEFAPEYFQPGTRDPYMLYDHTVRPEWQDPLRTITHLDATARVQTVGYGGSPFVRDLLWHWTARTGLPILCNTSANLNGSGFFPGAESAMAWGKCCAVYADGIIYQQTDGGLTA